MNPDAAGKSRSVGLWVYQFKSPEAIQAASFETIWVQGGQPLAETLAARPDFITFLPGEQAVRRLRRQPQTQYLAFVANFREPSGQQGWKNIVRIPPPGDPCAQARGQRATAPLRIHVYLQDFWIRVQGNFYIPPAAPTAPAPQPAPPPPQPAPPPQEPAPESSGWIDPVPE